MKNCTKRITAFLCMIIFPVIFAFSQDNKHSIAVYTSVLNGGTAFNKFNGFSSSTRVHTTSFAGAQFGITVSRKFRLHAGIEYSKYEVTEYEASVERDGHIQYFSIPVFLQAKLGKYFFYNFGLVMDVQASSDVRKAVAAIGIMGGAGFKYDFTNRINVFINPFCEMHGISSPPVSLIATGVRTGISYSF